MRLHTQKHNLGPCALTDERTGGEDSEGKYQWMGVVCCPQNMSTKYVTDV